VNVRGKIHKKPQDQVFLPKLWLPEKVLLWWNYLLLEKVLFNYLTWDIRTCSLFKDNISSTTNSH
jgi:hypothetical protein